MYLTILQRDKETFRIVKGKRPRSPGSTRRDKKLLVVHDRIEEGLLEDRVRRLRSVESARFLQRFWKTTMTLLKFRAEPRKALHPFARQSLAFRNAPPSPICQAGYRKKGDVTDYVGNKRSIDIELAIRASLIRYLLRDLTRLPIAQGLHPTVACHIANAHSKGKRKRKALDRRRNNLHVVSLSPLLKIRPFRNAVPVFKRGRLPVGIIFRRNRQKLLRFPLGRPLPAVLFVIP